MDDFLARHGFQSIPLPSGAMVAGRRELIVPTVCCQEPRIAILSSHLGKMATPPDAWLDRLREVIERAWQQRQWLLTTQGATLDAFLRGIARLQRGRVVRIRLPQARQRDAAWRREIRRRITSRAGKDLREDAWEAYLSPPLELPGPPDPEHGEARLCAVRDDSPTASASPPLPLGDAMLTLLADVVVLLAVRRDGRLRRVIDHGFSAGMFQNRRVLIALGDQLVSASVARPWLDQGAIGWYVSRRGAPTLPNHHRFPCHASASGAPTPPATYMPVVPLPSKRDRYLFHWTRSQPGPWPDQDNADYVRDLLWHPTRRDHSAAASLRRILTERRLVATSRLLCGGQPAVCFTARSLDEFPAARIFRPHQQRWDFEHYGIGIDRNWLQQSGARPVVYRSGQGSANPRHGATFTQPSANRRGTIQWQTEAEWRLAGDLDLRSVPDDAAIVFVPNAFEASRIAPWSRWPIVTLSAAI